MGMTQEDYDKNEVIEELQYKEVMRQATLSQCIYLFVEGQSEEAAIPILLKRSGVDLEKDGIVVANYNGISNLPHVLRLMSQTLSYDRPIIVTFDNDLAGKGVGSKIAQYLNSESKIALQTIPSSPVVSFNNGHLGGSFEEAFDPQHFVDTCFQDCFMSPNIAQMKLQFISSFDNKKPWLDQVDGFCRQNGQLKSSVHKITLALELAKTCPTTPSSFTDLANLVKRTRLKYPVKHPEDVELPKIPGLTR